MKKKIKSWMKKGTALAAALTVSMTQFSFPVWAGETSEMMSDVNESVWKDTASIDMEDGEYSIDITLEGGSGRASLDSPALLIVQDGKACAQIQWSSSHYDYMKINGEKYLPVNTEGNSVFQIPVTVFDKPVDVVGDTTVMSTPHEVEYQLTFHKDTIAEKNTAASNAEEKTDEKTEEDSDTAAVPADRDTDISPELTYDGSMELTYANQFAVDYYKEAFSLITISNGERYLVVPEGKEAPTELDEDIQVLQQPLDNIYLVASAVMDMFISLDALDSVRFSGLKEDAWYLDEAKKAMKAGDILYAGKYSAPDYEQILAEKCDLAVENTMIYHTPEVEEQLTKFGIPVMVDYSSYEKEPLGRTEWVKLYGLLTGHEEKAEEAFNSEEKAFAAIKGEENTGKTVAFFYITNNGEVNVRRTSDYLPKMIEMAGGKYIFQNLGDENSTSSTMSMQMEEFYAQAKDADYIIYNSTIDGELSSVDEMTAKSQLLGNFKAVKDGKVYCTTKNLYQSSMELGTIISDIHEMLSGNDDELTYLYKLK